MRPLDFTLPFALALLAFTAAGCGDDDVAPPGDAGVLDAALDAGADAGEPPSDAGTDAGLPDAGPPSPLEMARDDARAAVGAAGEAFGMLPANVRESAELLAVDLTLVRLDAVIGEKLTSLIDLVGVIGEKRLIVPASLPVSSIPAIVAARQLARIVRDIDNELAIAPWARSPEPMRMALAARLRDARDRLATLRDLVWARYRAIVDAVPISTYPEDLEYETAMVVRVPPGGTELHVIVEGRDVASPEANLQVGCSARAVRVRVFDEERGSVDPVATGEIVFGGIPIPLPPETPSSIRIAIDDTATDTSWPQCTFEVFGHRHWRGEAIGIDAAEAMTLDLLFYDWQMRSSTLAGEIETIALEGSPEEQEAARVVRAFFADASGDTAAWRGPIRALYGEDHEIHDLLFTRVIDVVGAHLESSPALASSTFEATRAALAALRGIEDSARQTLAPDHTGL